MTMSAVPSMNASNANGESTAAANAAILYEPEAYSLTSPQLKGRQAAGHGFLKGFARYAKTEYFAAWVRDPKLGDDFERAVREMGRMERCERLDARRTDRLAEIGCLYRPDPVVSAHAWSRGWSGHQAWSICGIVHTTASKGVMGEIAQWLTAPLQEWDAVICTSNAVRAMVRTILEAQGEHLRRRLSATRLPLPQLPVIPLGVHADDFSFTSAQRARAREILGLTDATVAVLFVGRLSFHGKAHPLAMYQALERAQHTTGREVVLIECGWHANAAIVGAYQDAARLACPSVRVVTLDGRAESQRTMAWAAADLFCSLSDNIQETFGLTPLEAMAAGLPVVVSDWDGYRDTVRDGVDGFAVPTMMPAAGLGMDLAQRYALDTDSYDHYCGYSSQLVAVDIDGAARALTRLIADPMLRQRMGQAGAQRVRNQFDWRVIIARYQSLWAELAERRRRAAAPLPDAAAVRAAWPTHMDPYDIFAGYATAALRGNTPLRSTSTTPDEAMQRLAQLRKLAMVSFVEPMVISDEEARAVLRHFETQTVVHADELVADFPPERQSWALRSLAWLVKLGILGVR